MCEERAEEKWLGWGGGEESVVETGDGASGWCKMGRQEAALWCVGVGGVGWGGGG